MIRTIISAIITLALIIGISLYEINYVQATFDLFHTELRALKQKTELGKATYTDGLAVRSYWDTKKQALHVWVPHNALAEIDYQLDEAIGFLYVEDYAAAMPKIEVILGLSENVPLGYTLRWGNIF